MAVILFYRLVTLMLSVFLGCFGITYGYCDCCGEPNVLNDDSVCTWCDGYLYGRQ